MNKIEICIKYLIAKIKYEDLMSGKVVEYIGDALEADLLKQAETMEEIVPGAWEKVFGTEPKPLGINVSFNPMIVIATAIDFDKNTAYTKTLKHSDYYLYMHYCAKHKEEQENKFLAPGISTIEYDSSDKTKETKKTKVDPECLECNTVLNDCRDCMKTVHERFHEPKKIEKLSLFSVICDYIRKQPKFSIITRQKLLEIGHSFNPFTPETTVDGYRRLLQLNGYLFFKVPGVYTIINNNIPHDKISAFRDKGYKGFNLITKDFMFDITGAVICTNIDANNFKEACDLLQADSIHIGICQVYGNDAIEWTDITDPSSQKYQDKLKASKWLTVNDKCLINIRTRN
jgi:hypothetical protein